MTGVSTAGLLYDANGNLTSDGQWTYTYDLEDRLVRAVGGPLSDTITYEYGPKGRRLAKVSLLEGRTEYLYEGDEPIADYAGNGRLLRRYVNGAAIDERLIAITYDEAAPTETVTEQLYAHANHQGSVVALSDGSGALVHRFTYGPYGRVGAGEEAGPPFRFTGRRYDADTGLYYYRARYYSPALGLDLTDRCRALVYSAALRELQVDPIGYEDQMNLYAYTGNDPVNFVDPAGEAAVSINIDLQGSLLGFGIGFSVKGAISLSRVEGGSFKFQAGGVSAIKTGASKLTISDPNSTLIDRTGSALALLTDTGFSGGFEVGVFAGTDQNPADVEDLGGTSVSLGGALSKKKLARNLPGGIGKIVEGLPGPSVTGQFVTGANGIKGIELGAGIGVGLTNDVEIASEPKVLEKEMP